MGESKRRTGKFFKRALLVVLCFVLVTGTALTIMAANLSGDINGDGKVTAFDAQLLAEYQAGKRELTAEQLLQAAGLTVRNIINMILGRSLEDDSSLAEGIQVTVEVTAEDGVVTEAVSFSEGIISVTVPAGVKVTGETLTLTVQQKAASESNVMLEDGQELLPLDIHIDGISAENTVPVIICVGGALDAGLNLGNLTLYHVENGVSNPMTQVESADALSAHNDFYYDPANGDITVSMATFSEVAMVSDTDKVWKGECDSSWYKEDEESFEIFNADQLAGLGKLVDDGHTFKGKTVTLCMDVTLSDGSHADRTIPFDPIGYGYAYDTTNGRAFKGTFDGNGNTIYNLYQNGWDLGYSYSTAGGGLFASVYGATIKNLTMDNAYIVMECIDMGTVVGYAQGNCTFENIVVRNSTLANYQRYTGGAIGEVSNGHHILKNVDVEASTTVGTLWGDFDAAVGGIIGGKWGHSYDTEAGKDGYQVSVYMEKCDSAAKLDVYNDVTSAYQWYSYRRAGMLIGYTGESENVNGRTEATASFLKTKDCTVQYGDWVNYHYCEFGSTTSLSARYPWVRVEASEFNGAYSNPRYGVPTFSEQTLDVTAHDENDGCHVDGDGHNVEIVFNQLYGGGQGCYGGNSHVDNGVTVIGAIEPTTKFVSTVKYAQTGTAVKLGDLFQAADGADIQSAYVYAFVSPANETSTVKSTKTTPSADTDWTELEINFSGTGEAKIVITDYYYCTETVLNVLVVEQVETVEAWVLVTNAATLQAGDQLVIASNTKSAVAGDIGTNTYMDSVGATFSADKATIDGELPANAVVLTLGGTKDAWTLANGSDEQLTETEEKKLAWGSGTWKITIAESGEATVQGGSAKLQYNASSPRFTTYNSNQTPIQLYRLEEVTVCAHAQTNTVCVEATCITEGTETETCVECGETVSTTTIEKLEHEYSGDGGVCVNGCGKTESKQFTLMDLSEIKSADTVVITMKTSGGTVYALPNDTGTDGSPDAVVVTVEGEIITSEVAERLQWNIVKDAENNLTIYPAGDTAKWLYCINDNAGVCVGTNENNVFTVDATSGYLQHKGTSRYLGVYTSNPDWRCYTNTTGNTANQTLAFYVIAAPTCETHTVVDDEAVAATCSTTGLTAGSHCSVCNEVIVAQTTVAMIDHTYVDGTCSVCGAVESSGGDEPTTKKVTNTYTFSDYTAGTQYADNEVHKLDEYVTVTTTDCHFTTELRIYASSTYDGYAIISSSRKITGLSFNAGNKADTLNVYGSNDGGETWTLIAEVAVTSSYTDYTVDFSDETYSQLKLDVKGTNQVRIKNMTLTTEVEEE